jgi:hypothetical protein
LIALHSLGFYLTVTIMLGITWHRRNCYVKTGFGISEWYYKSSTSKQSVGLGQGSTAISDIWCVINGAIVHTLASIYSGFMIHSVYSNIIHKRIGEGLIDDTRLVASPQSYTENTSTRVIFLTKDEDLLFPRMKKMMQFFL